MPTTQTHKQATYTLDGGCSDCGAKRPKTCYTEYAHYELATAIEGERGKSSGEPFVALVALENSRDERDAVHEEAMCTECEVELTNIEISDWRPSRERRALDGLDVLYQNMELADANSPHSGADHAAALYELLNSLGFPVA